MASIGAEAPCVYSQNGASPKDALSSSAYIMWRIPNEALRARFDISFFKPWWRVGRPILPSSSRRQETCGGPLNSFMKKCESDAQITCDKQAADKKLSGAAKDSFAKKCVKDATGA